MLFERTEIVKSFDGTDLFFRCYSPRKRDRRSRTEGLILAVHGFGEHSGRFEELAAIVAEQNLSLVAFDLRGHGKSGPRRGDVDSLGSMVLDLVFLLNHLRTMFGINSAENFLGIIGQSFGGLLATYAAAALGTSCPPLLLASPLFRPRQKVPVWKRLVTATVPRIAPIVQLQLNLPVSNVPQTPPEAPGGSLPSGLNLDSASARMNEIVLEALDDLRIRHAIELTRVPVTILCGEKDPIVDVERIRDVFSLFENESSSLHVIPSAGHEALTAVVNETTPGAQILKQWIANRGVVT